MEKVLVCTLVYLNMNYSPTATNDIVSTMVVATKTRPKCQDHPSPTARYPLTDEGCIQNPIFNVKGHQTWSISPFVGLFSFCFSDILIVTQWMVWSQEYQNFVCWVLWLSRWGWFWKELLLVTDASTTWAEVIFRVKWIVFVSRWYHKPGTLNVICQLTMMVLAKWLV